MRDRVQAWMPRDVESPIHVFRGFTVRDMMRVGIPSLVGWVAAGSVLGGAAGAAAGFVLYVFRPKDDALDVHAANAARHYLGVHPGSWPEVKTAGENVAILDNDVVVGAVKVDSVDLSMLSETEQETLQDVVADLYGTVEYPIKVYSLQAEQSIDRYSVPDERGVFTEHLVFAYESFGGVTDSADEAIKTVKSRCREIRQELSGADFSAERVSSNRLSKLVDKIGFEGVSITPRTFSISEELTFRAVYVTGYPEQVAVGWLADVLNVDGTVMTVQSLRPEDPDRIAKLRNRIEAEWSITTDPRRGSELERRAEAVKQIEDRSVSGDNPVKFGVMIAAYGSDKDEASETIQKVKQVLRRHRISFREPIFRMHKAAKSVSVSHRNRPISAQTATSWSAAAAFQFASYDYFESGGIVFGSDDRSGDPVILDRFSWDAGHIARMGKIGSGKSYAAKLEILRSLDRYDDLQVIVIDPKQEYGDVTGVSDRVKRLTVEDRTQDNTGRLIGFVRRAYQAGHDHDGKTVVVLDEAHRVLNDDTGRQVLGELVREGRDQDIAVTLITQNADDFTRSQEGRNMLRQMDCYVFMRHQDVESSVEDFFNLSDRERIRLRKLRTGSKVGFSEAVIRGPVNTVLRIESLDTEKPVLEEEASSPGTDGEEG